MIGKYVDLTESYKSLSEALYHAGLVNGCEVEIAYVDSEIIEEEGVAAAVAKAVGERQIDAFLIPGGFGDRGTEGKIESVRYARENKIPFLGICLGLQMAVVEYARNKAGLKDATSREFAPDSEYTVIDLMETQKDVEQKGGSMRLGAYPCTLKPNTIVHQAYQQDNISERHRHRFEVNNNYRDILEKAGMVFSGISPNQELVEIIELPDHPWFVGVQFHPEFKSSPRTSHPLFKSFIAAALKYRNARIKSSRKKNKVRKAKESGKNPSRVITKAAEQQVF